MWLLHFACPFCKQILNVTSPHDNLILPSAGYPGGAVRPATDAKLRKTNHLRSRQQFSWDALCLCAPRTKQLRSTGIAALLQKIACAVMYMHAYYSGLNNRCFVATCWYRSECNSARDEAQRRSNVQRTAYLPIMQLSLLLASSCTA